MTTRTLQLGAIMLAAGAALLHAQALDVKLGLWEITTTSETTGTPQIDTSKMTPEQRARVEAALQARGARGATPPRVRRGCITKEAMEKDKNLFQDSQANDSSCKRTIVTDTRVLQEMRVECAAPRKMTGTLRVEVLAPDKVRASTKMAAGEGPQVMTFNQIVNARWVSAACGDVK